MARVVELVVEDGSLTEPNANSFVTEEQIWQYALSRGITIAHVTDPELDAIAILGIKAMDFIRSKRYRGELVSPTQPLPFPRKNPGFSPEFPEDEIPGTIIQAQLALALMAQQGIELIVTVTEGWVTEEQVGPIKTKYSEKVGVGTFPLNPLIDNLLYPWILTPYEGMNIFLKTLGGCSDG